MMENKITGKAGGEKKISGNIDPRGVIVKGIDTFFCGKMWRLERLAGVRPGRLDDGGIIG
jgi:hypothetical protein